MKILKWIKWLIKAKILMLRFSWEILKIKVKALLRLVRIIK